MNVTLRKRQLRESFDSELSWWTYDRTAWVLVIVAGIVMFALAIGWVSFVGHCNRETSARILRAEANQPAERWVAN